MAKIDVTQIEGYAVMTAEEKIAALEGFDIKFDSAGYVKKDTYDKMASELAKLKKSLAERKTPEESQADNDRIADLEKQIKVMNLEKKYLAAGYTAENAAKAANAFVDNDTETLFDLQTKHIEAVKKATAAEAMKQTPPPESGHDEGSPTDYSKLIAQAQANGNFGEAAYYTRLQQSEEQNQT